MSLCRIKKDDVVIAIAGDDAGKTGKVLAVNRKTGRAVVEGLNIVKKTVRKCNAYPDGAIIDVPAPIHMSNLMPYDPEAKKGVRVSRVREGDTVVRVAKGTGYRFESK